MIKKINFAKIEKKWQDKWEKEKIFEPEINKKKKKFFVNFPYPYINGYSHIGHLFSLMRVEAFARYKRARGFNVLFPQGWHATGSPIVNAAKRIKEKEPKQIKMMKDMGIKDFEIKKFEESKYWLDFFAPEYRKDYKSIGMSIDWRREFYTTSLNSYYDKFIQWQFRKLKEKGYCIQGSFPVVWDPKENVAVGDHARVEGEGETPQEFYLFKFPLDDGRNIVTSTLRHDTILGITNVYVNPDVNYVEIETKRERWIVGRPIIEKLKNQKFDVKITREVSGKSLIGKKVESFGEKKILVLPASFLNPNYGTGIVHSVPSDSADDLIALQDLQKDKKLMKKYNLNEKEIKAIKPIEIFNTLGVGRNSAQYFLDKYRVKSQNERDKLEKIKKELYKLTFTKSRFGPLYRKGFSKNLEGMPVSKGQEIIKEDLLKQGKIEIFYELTGKVLSRSLTECVVKIVDDQWFLDYANKDWKKKTYECLKQMKLYPEKSRHQFEYVIDWLHEWACTREEGLGTKLPWDDKWLIESLSDSTIYMAYYTIAHLIKKFKIGEINDEFFDYVFLSKGKGKKEWDKLKKEFEYWYPVDFRNSGKDLIQNHLTFFLFNHVAIFSKKDWPAGVGVNGWITVDGQKMSKSLGNMIPIREIVKKFGADVSRLTILNGGEGMEDPNWDSKFAKILKKKFENINTLIRNYGKGSEKLNKIDEWMENKLFLHISEATGFMEATLFRSTIQKIFFDLFLDIKWYLKRTNEPNKKILRKVIESFIIMIQPFIPHLAEELWEKIGKKDFVSLEKWPEFKIRKFEDTEEVLKKLIWDIRNLLRLVKKKPSKAFIYVIPKEFDLYNESVNFLNKELNLKVEICANNKKVYDPMSKAKKAKLSRPSIYLE